MELKENEEITDLVTDPIPTTYETEKSDFDDDSTDSETIADALETEDIVYTNAPHAKAGTSNGAKSSQLKNVEGNSQSSGNKKRKYLDAFEENEQACKNERTSVWKELISKMRTNRNYVAQIAGLCEEHTDQFKWKITKQFEDYQKEMLKRTEDFMNDVKEEMESYGKMMETSRSLTIERTEQAMTEVQELMKVSKGVMDWHNVCMIEKIEDI